MPHTKGDWIAEKIGNEGKCAIHTGDISTLFAHTFPNRYCKPQVSAEEAQANAQLIAAAPKLLEACKRLLKVAQWTEVERRTFTATPDIVIAKLAIAKAGRAE